MSFVPLTGPAVLHAGEAPRDGTVEFTDDRRTITLPIRAALPVLAKARTADDAHPSVALLAAASLLGMRFVAAGKFEPGDGGWRLSALDPDDAERIRRLAESRAHTGLSPEAAEAVVRRVVDAVVDAMPRTRRRPTRAEPHRLPPGRGFPTRRSPVVSRISWRAIVAPGPTCRSW